MPKPLALLFAILTVVAFVGVAGSIAYRNVWAILIFLLVGLTLPVVAIRMRKRWQS